MEIFLRHFRYGISGHFRFRITIRELDISENALFLGEGIEGWIGKVLKRIPLMRSSSKVKCQGEEKIFDIRTGFVRPPLRKNPKILLK
jgi:hypothetical protein